MTVQNSSVLLTSNTAELLDRPWSDWVELVASGAELGSAHLQALDYVLRHGVVRLLSRRASDAELADAARALRRMVPPSRRDELAEPLARWTVFSELLEARRAVMAEQDPDAALKLAHAEAIVDLVARERDLTQAKIGERLELKSANLSRILGVLEANEVIGRRKDGRSKRVALGPNAPQTAQVPAGEPPGPRPLRTSDLLSPYDAFAWPDAGVEH